MKIRFPWVVVGALACLTPLQAHAQDTDGDGVLDVRDICPSTRTGRTVDGAGCDAFCEVVSDTTNGSAFLRSRLLEVGAADFGSFGTVNAPPAGWHPRNPDDPTQFGFVANPDDDDWATIKGDFFVPGTPEEGFGLSVGGTDYFASRLMMEQTVVGDFTGTVAACRPMICGLRGGASAFWAGTVAGIDIEQTYSVFNEGVFILIQVTLDNTTATEQTVFYLRNVDPDNMQPVTSDYNTLNTIVSQGDGSATSLALVSATTAAPNESYLALGSSDPDARVAYGGFSNRAADDIWNCVAGFTCTVGSSENNDIAISLAVRKVIPAGGTASFSFVYALSAGSVAESLACTVPAICGDGAIEGTESCDDGNTTDGDGCSMTCGVEPGWDCTGEPSTCTEICGDSMVVGAEICDTGADSATCDADCTLAECGDSTVNSAAGETCDDGNTTDGDGCSSTCTMESCGDGTVDPGEDCDDGGETATCDDDCTTVTCGDNNPNAAAGEACDDGNTVDGDGCSATCMTEGCGNGTVEGTEECDDGNTSAGDGCSATCTIEVDGGMPDGGTDPYGLSGGGCTCSVNGATDPRAPIFLTLAFLALVIVRRRR